MPRPRVRRPWPVPVLAGLLLWALAGRAMPAEPPHPGDDLTQVESLRTKDHPRFVEALARLHGDASKLDAKQAWQLRYLDGWETDFEGDFARAEGMLRDVIAHSGDQSLVVKATALLINNLSMQGKYAEAYAMASRATDLLPRPSDPVARFMLLSYLSQMMNFAGQNEQALQYADLMAEATPPGESSCQATALRVAALEGARRLTSASSELGDAVNVCSTAGQRVFANAMSLILVDRLLDEKQPTRALATLDRIDADIRNTGYFPHRVSEASQRARAYVQLGKDTDAETYALQAVAMSHPGDMNEWLRAAYKVLYSIEKARNHSAAALDYYEHYVTQDQGYLQDVRARTAAYEAAQQHFLTERLETDGLSKENRILRLQQALDAKAVETGRLYISLLMLALVSVVFWLVRIKRSQLRFKWLSSCDGLTGIFHHQHFMGEAERGLRTLEKRAGYGCLLSLDLDHFKQVNDTYGHVVGDAVLKHAVSICKAQLRQADILGRLGGEEFGILLMDAPSLQGSVVAERIRLAIEATPLVIDDIVVEYSASIGLACTGSVGYELQRLYRASDAALYRAKRTGRNRVVTDTDLDPMDPAPPRRQGVVEQHGAT
jgi:diguanylate cyclase (GGDEF)-like protein